MRIAKHCSRQCVADELDQLAGMVEHLVCLCKQLLVIDCLRQWLRLGRTDERSLGIADDRRRVGPNEQAIYRIHHHMYSAFCSRSPINADSGAARGTTVWCAARLTAVVRQELDSRVQPCVNLLVLSLAFISKQRTVSRWSGRATALHWQAWHGPTSAVSRVSRGLELEPRPICRPLGRWRCQRNKRRTRPASFRTTVGLLPAPQ